MNATVATDPVTLLLSRLEGVRQYGEGWRADCPTGHRSRGTLAIAQGEDGRCLVHCHAACAAEEVAAAAGLHLQDLFPPNPKALTPAEREAARKRMREAGWAAALGVLAYEALVIAAGAGMAIQGTLAAGDAERLRLAIARVQAAREALR